MSVHCDHHGFRVTYETFTAESCEAGDCSDRGWLDWLGSPVDQPVDSHWDLQDLCRLQGYRFEGDGARVPRWLTCEADMSDLIHCARPGLSGLCPGRRRRAERVNFNSPPRLDHRRFLAACLLPAGMAVPLLTPPPLLTLAPG